MEWRVASAMLGVAALGVSGIGAIRTHGRPDIVGIAALHPMSAAPVAMEMAR